MMGSVAVIRLDNPERLNALTPAMLSELESHCKRLDSDSSALGVVVTGTGERAFCSGADINAWEGLPPADFARQWVRDGHRILDRLARLSKPTIAAISGIAFGGGLELAAACDIRVLAIDAVLSLPETRIGIVPGWSGTQRLARLLPEPVLKEMALFGRMISANRALELGFAAEVSDRPLREAQEFMARLADCSPRATEAAKYMIHAGVSEDRAAMIDSLAGGMTAATDDRMEGVASFHAKRKPEFQGR